MIRKYVQPHLTVLICLTCLSLSAGASAVQGSFERKYQVSGPAQLEIDTGSWDVTVHKGPAGMVTVSGKIRVSDRWLNGGRTARVEDLQKNPPLRQDGNTIHVDHVSLNNISVDYEITVPENTRVHARTDSGDVKIADLRGDIDLESGSGDMWLENITGNIRTHSGSGDVQGRAISGDFRSDASSGDIRLDQKSKANVEIHTGSGNIEASGVQGALQIEASSGDVTVEGTPAGSWEARTGSGNIHLHTPANAAFNLEASTSSGEIEVSHAVTMTVKGNLDASRHAVNGTVGGGGPTVTVHTGSGDVDID